MRRGSYRTCPKLHLPPVAHIYTPTPNPENSRQNHNHTEEMAVGILGTIQLTSMEEGPQWGKLLGSDCSCI